MDIDKRIERVAKEIVAGAASFYNSGKGTDPTKIFNMLRENALAESGHGGYTGTIAEKGGYKIVSEPLPLDEARKLAKSLIDENDKFDPAFAIPYTADTAVDTVKKVEIKPFKVTANTMEEAVKLANETVLQKYRDKYKGYRVELENGKFNVSVLKSAGWKMKVKGKLKTEPQKAYMWEIDGKPFSDYQHRTSFRDAKSAVAEMEKYLDSLSKSGKPLPKTTMLFEQVFPKPIIDFTVISSGKGTQVPNVWHRPFEEDTAASKDVIGYLFFGYASE